MNEEMNYAEMGREIGLDSVDRLVDHAEALCNHATRQISLENQPHIQSLRAEYTLCLERQDIIKTKLRDEPPPGDIRTRRRSAAYHAMIAAFLIVAAIAFSILALEPFRMGWKGDLYCLGIGLVTPFLVEKVITAWQVERTMKWVVALAGMAALVSMILLAIIRGDILMQELTAAAQAVVIDGVSSLPRSVGDFYARDTSLLRAVMVFLAVAIEVGAGIAIHTTGRMLSNSDEDWRALRDELKTVQERLVAMVHELTTLQNEAQVFAERFWRHFYQAVLTKSIKKAIPKLMLIVVILLIWPHHARAAEKANWVIAVDLSQSVGVKGGGHGTPFSRNIDAVTRVLAEAPAASRVTVIGITGDSFLEPSILLSAEIPADPGYFGEQLASAHTKVVKAWLAQCKRLRPTAKHSDILGAVLLAANVFEETPDAAVRRLVIFSDMRQDTTSLNLEATSAVEEFQDMKPRIRSQMPKLVGVNVYVLGCEEKDESVDYWQSLRRFWLRYFSSAGAAVVCYSVLRDLPSQPRKPSDYVSSGTLFGRLFNK